MSGEQIVALPDLFGQFKVVEMSVSHFWIGNNPLTQQPYATPTALRVTKCVIILFYEPISTDPEMIDIWNQIAQDVAGPTIAAVNTSSKTEIMNAFFETGNNPDHPLNNFSIQGTPTILVYRSGWPQAFYNGELSYDAIKKWILILACKPGYREPDSTFIGTRAIASDIYLEDTRIENYPYPTSSRDFTASIGETPRGAVEYSENYNNIPQQQNGQIVEKVQNGQIVEKVQDIGFIDEDDIYFK